MAVEDKYIDANIVAGKLALPQALASGQIIYGCATFEVAAADDDGSVYRVFPNLSSQLIPIKLELTNDAITAATDYDIGFYEPDGGAVVDADALADGLDISAGNAVGSPANGLAAVLIEEVQSRLFELAGETEGSQKGSYDLCITANTVGTAAGTISMKAWFAVA